MSGGVAPGARPSEARPPAVAGLFYPGEARRARRRWSTSSLAGRRGARSRRRPAWIRRRLAGDPRPARRARLLGARRRRRVARASLPASPRSPPGGAAPTVVLLGTNHGAAWLDGVGRLGSAGRGGRRWATSPWTRELTDAVLALGPPFVADARCHLGEHSLEVQLPFVARLAPGARIVALSVGTGTGGRAIEAGERLGRAAGRAPGGGRAGPPRDQHATWPTTRPPASPSG